MNSKLYNLFRLLAIVITAVAIVGQKYLPKKVAFIHPHPTSTYQIYADGTAGGKSTVEWVDRSKLHWRCELIQSDVYPFCGFSMTWPAEPGEVRDFTPFDSINIKLRYTGGASKVRLYIRNFNQAYATDNIYESSKFNSVTLRVSDLNTDANIRLSEFHVADWWIEAYDIPREHAQPEFNSVLAFGIDYPHPLVFGEHHMVVEKIELVGAWITPEQLYFAIIVFWMIILFWEGTSRLYMVYRRTKRDSQKIEDLTTYTAELKAETDKYKEMSSTDPLTGALNRAGLAPVVDAMFNRKDAARNATLMLFDIDHFKRINDRRGHDAGDRILKTLVKIVEENTRGVDTFARWGGEEFILLCPQTNSQSATILAEKIRTLVSKHVFEPHNPLDVTLSIGMALVQPGEGFDDAFKRADKALYKAKELGRNCTVMAP